MSNMRGNDTFEIEMGQTYTRANTEDEDMELGPKLYGMDHTANTPVDVNSANLSNFIKIKRSDDIRLGRGQRPSLPTLTGTQEPLKSQPQPLALQRSGSSDSTRSLKNDSRKPSVQSRKLSIMSEDNDQLMVDFGNAIRSGDIESVTSILQNNNPDILKMCKISFQTRFRTLVVKNRKKSPAVYASDVMFLTPFHLAIIAQQSDVVATMLQTVLTAPPEDWKTFYLELLKAKTKVHFSRGKPDDYYKDDRTLDKINAIHIAGRFHAQSLFVIIKFLMEQGFLLLPEFHGIFEERDSHMGKTPLQMAVKGPSPLSTKVLLLCGVDYEARDNRGYTALHMAAKEGSEGHCSTLLEHGANPNVHGNMPNFHKTPLHRARTQKVVQLLIKHGANPFARMIEEDELDATVHEPSAGPTTKSVLDCLLRRHPQAIEEIMNTGIQTNGQDLDSNDLQIIFDFEMFFREGLPLESSNHENLAFIDEMAVHKKFVHANERDLLKHPLAEAFLHMKYQMVQKFSLMNSASYALFLFTLTILAIIQTSVMKCREDVDPAQLQCGSKGKWDVDGIFPVLQIYWSSEIAAHKALAASFATFYIFTLFGLSFLTFREGLQAASYWRIWVCSRENLLEAFICICTSIYMILQFFHPEVAIHFGAWAVFSGWIEMTLLLGRIPSIGIFIYMSVNVMKTLVIFLLVYSPALIAFAMTFHILLPSKETFSNPLFAPIKILAMMTGELDLDEYFSWTESKNDAGQFTTQVIFVAFCVFVSIVIANLLIGLTVSKTEELFKEAGGIRLEKTVNQVAGLESIFIKGQKQSFFNTCLPINFRRKINKNCRLFFKLRNSFPKGSGIDGRRPSPWKVCVLPHSLEQLKANSKGRKFLDIKASLDTSASSFEKSFWVYLYDDLQGFFVDEKLPFTIPAWVIGKTLTMLRDRKSLMDHHIAQQIEQEINSDEGGTLLKLMRESASISARPETKIELKQVLEELKEATNQQSTTPISSPTRRFSTTAHSLSKIEEAIEEANAEPGETVEEEFNLESQVKDLKSDIQELKTILLSFKEATV